MKTTKKSKATPNKGGAPSKLKQDVKDKIVASLQRGATYEIASQYAGICYKTFRNWMIEGESTDDITSPYFQFLQDIKRAEAEGSISRLNLITKAASKDWKAAAWIQERRYPHDYGRTVQEHAGKIQLSHEQALKELL